MNSFDEMALEFMCLLDEAKTARLYQRKIVKLVNKMLNESTDPDGKFTSIMQNIFTELINEQYFITVVQSDEKKNW